ncbi:methyl-CpG-binding domain protein 4-like [Achroia grisella]|uniref:methyl-CpG-binding domain protein 4-like n=1 Tax=Achroia grisella TaxID=688607 RepID=UPI0027D2FC35|nr:methyl-CpG-binding domain protein 4-like [Achroia grisella]XP_059050721.1 methyl-CpG-binding domain protein 4-like [Achroia grisella]XP_059050728.1 methyl-CpG-binding domain protein 4-like [Achroia grisella]
MEEHEDCTSKYFQNQDLSSKSPSKVLLSPSKSFESSPNISQSTDSDADFLSLSQLDIEEQEPLEINPFFNITPRHMPLSPHYVFEEEFSSNPWAMLVATIFLTKTSGKTARPYMKSFFEDYPTPYHVLNDNPASLERFFENLGLKKRSRMIWKLSFQFVSSKWRRASDLCGVGKYGEDAYRIFCLGHTDLDPDDRYLKLYLNWLRGCTEFPELHSVLDSDFVIEDPVSKYYRLTLRD